MKATAVNSPAYRNLILLKLTFQARVLHADPFSSTAASAGFIFVSMTLDIALVGAL